MRMAHTLKGSAGVIGAIALAEVSGRIERRLRRVDDRSAGCPAASDLLAELERGLADTCAAIDSLPKVGPVKGASSGDPQAVWPRLSDLLARHDTEALAIWESSQATLLTALGDRGAEFDASLRRFDFARAAEVLGDLPSQH